VRFSVMGAGLRCIRLICRSDHAACCLANELFRPSLGVHESARSFSGDFDTQFCPPPSRCCPPFSTPDGAKDDFAAVPHACQAPAEPCVCEACCTTLGLPGTHAEALEPALPSIWEPAPLIEPISHRPDGPRRPPRTPPRDQHRAAAPMPAMSSGISTSFSGRWLIGGLADCHLDQTKENP
jgi:hypothetical protein